jgi:methyltransferase (TIGR00027 family)
VTPSPIQNVADTAFWVAHYRAEETERPDALFRDPLAKTLAGEHGRDIAARMPAAAMTRWQTVVRTRVIDELLRELVTSSAVDTVLNLGAGLDTRPYRMDLPATLRWVEVDQPEVLDFKTKQLEGQLPRCALERHPANLADANERRALLERVCGGGHRVVVLTEGVVPYLSNDDVAALAEDLRRQPEVVGWIAEYFSARVMKYRARRMARATERAPFQFQPPEWFAFFEAHGWKLKQARYLPAEGQRLGRPFPAPPVVRAVMTLLRWLRVNDASLNTMGYVLYAPIDRP